MMPFVFKVYLTKYNMKYITKHSPTQWEDPIYFTLLVLVAFCWMYNTNLAHWTAVGSSRGSGFYVSKQVVISGKDFHNSSCIPLATYCVRIRYDYEVVHLDISTLMIPFSPWVELWQDIP